ncbi:MAG TPA: esterase [Planctomycetes bacterium]|nr:esterase [Planctomycetota bacterium]
MGARLVSRREADPAFFDGRAGFLLHESRCLAANPLGDPALRDLAFYCPPAGAGERLAVWFLLPGFTGDGKNTLETHPWRRGLLARYHRAVLAGTLEPAVLVVPDCFTRLGGSQYVNSSAVGAYEDYVVNEITRLVDAELPVDPTRRGVIGKSSGGYGALRLSMRHPGLFSACAAISPDVGFEAMFAGEFLACLRGLVRSGGDPARFLEDFAEKPDLSGDGHAVVNVLAMAACYSPNPESPLGFDLPFDLETGERIDEVWQRWLAFDPLEATVAELDGLRALSHLHLECGLADQFHLQWGLRRFARRLGEAGIPHAHEEHEGGHFGIGERVLDAIARITPLLGSAEPRTAARPPEKR